MSNIATQNIDLLTDEEIKILIKNDDLGNLLDPIKHNQKHFVAYNPSIKTMLGRMDKKSVLVQNNLPKIVFDLYKRQEPNYTKHLEMVARRMKVMLKTVLDDVFSTDFQMNLLNELKISDYKKVFQYILDDKNAKLDLPLFFVQLKLYNIELKDEEKQEIEKEWQQLSSLQETRNELALTLAKEYEAKEKVVQQKFDSQKEVLKNQINLLNTQIKTLQNKLTESENEVSRLTQNSESQQAQISTLQNNILVKNKDYSKLYEKLLAEQEKSKILEKEIQKKSMDFYQQINHQWQQDNALLIEEKNKLEGELVLYKAQVKQLQEEERKREKKVKEWDQYIDSYVERIEEKIIEKKVETILIQNPAADNSKVNDGKIFEEDELFVIAGSKQEDLEPCEDYYDYLSVVETNLENAGEKMYIGLVAELFNASINIGLRPLICGFNARRIALALTAARYGEKSEIISIPVGFSKTKVLLQRIEQARTKSIIIEDAFGTLNEKMLLPILRSCIDKVLIFTAEDSENLKYVANYYYNYLQLIMVDKQVVSKSNIDIYAQADHIFKHIVYSNKDAGHKLARYLFDHTSLNDIYIYQRGCIFTELSQECMENSEQDIIKKYFMGEARWILGEADKEEIKDTIENDPERFSGRLLEFLKG